MIRAALILGVGLAGSAVAQPTLGVGVLCSYALVVGLQTYQQACHPDRAEDARFLAPLIAKHRWFVTQNADWDAARHATFVAEQTALVSDCGREDLRQMMETIFAEPRRLEKGVDQQLAQGRKPDWGVCF